MIYVVIDTNVLVSAVLRNRDPEFVIEWIVNSPEYLWVASPKIVLEYLTILSRPKLMVDSTSFEKWKKFINANAYIADVPESEYSFLRDPSDAKFLALAEAVSARYLLTGDKDFDMAIELTTIISVQKFKQLVVAKS